MGCDNPPCDKKCERKYCSTSCANQYWNSKRRKRTGYPNSSKGTQSKEDRKAREITLAMIRWRR